MSLLLTLNTLNTLARFQPMFHFYTPWKHFFRGNRSGTLVENGLINCFNYRFWTYICQLDNDFLPDLKFKWGKTSKKKLPTTAIFDHCISTISVSNPTNPIASYFFPIVKKNIVQSSPYTKWHDFTTTDIVLCFYHSNKTKFKMEVLHSETQKIHETKLREFTWWLASNLKLHWYWKLFIFLDLIKSDSLVLSHYHQNIFFQGYTS